MESFHNDNKYLKDSISSLKDTVEDELQTIGENHMGLTESLWQIQRQIIKSKITSRTYKSACILGMILVVLFFSISVMDGLEWSRVDEIKTFEDNVKEQFIEHQNATTTSTITVQTTHTATSAIRTATTTMLTSHSHNTTTTKTTPS